MIGCVYILTKPVNKDLVKIGYSKDINKRLRTLNSSSAVPYSFELYATYEVDKHLEDMKLHQIIDKLNPTLRTVEQVGNKKRIREFFKMPKEDAYLLFQAIAELSGTEDRLKFYGSEQDRKDVEKREMQLNRHHFKEIKFRSSLTNKEYYTKTNERGTLSIYEAKTNLEVPSHSKISKKQIVLQALKDLNIEATNKETLYQLVHKLQKVLN